MHKFLVRLLTCLIVFSFLLPFPTAHAGQTVTASVEPSIQILPENLSDFSDESNAIVEAPLFIPPPPPPPTPEEVINEKDSIASKPPYPYYYYGINSQPVNLIPSANIILINNGDSCQNARPSLDLQLKQEKISIITEDTFVSLNYVLLFLSAELPAVSAGQSLNSSLKSSESNCVLPVFDRETYYLYATDEIIVKFKPEFSDVDLQQLISNYGLVTLDDNLGGLTMYLFQISPSLLGNVYDVSNDLVEKGFAEYAHPNFHYLQKEIEVIEKAPSQISVDEIIAVENQWNLEKINASGAWALLNQAGIESHAVHVAVIDSGVQRNHEDLSLNIGLFGYDAYNNEVGFSEGEPKGSSSCWAHGTKVTGVIAADSTNQIGISGVGRNFINIIPISVYGKDRCGESASATIIRGITWAVNNGAEVINMSLGGSLIEPFPSILTALNYAGANRVVVVASSGNSNGSEVVYPAAYAQVIAVGATTQTDVRKNCFISCNIDWGSNYGSALDIVAPGDRVPTTDLMGNINYVSADGTSFSAPHVAAVAAMMLAANPNLTPKQVQDILQRTAVKAGPDNYSGRPDEGGWNKYMGFGRLDAYEAVRAVFASRVPKLSIKVNTKDTQYDKNSANDVSIGVFGKYFDSSGRHPLLSEGLIRTDDEGNSIGSVQLPGIATGNYMVCAKPYHYLWRCLPATLTTEATTFLDFTSGGTYVFKVGDFNVNEEDGVINAHDRENFMKVLLSCINVGCENVPITGACKTVDLMRDYCINIGDFAAFNTNYSKFSDGFQFGGGYWRPFNNSATNVTFFTPNSSIDSSTGAVWLTGAVDSLSVGSIFTVEVMLDLTETSLGSGSNNISVYFDPGVLQVLDSYPDWVGVQIEKGDLFPAFDFGTVDPITGSIRFGGYVGTDATEGVKSVGTLALITFQVISSVASTEISTYWLPDETIDSNAAEFREGNDLISSASPIGFSTSGSPSRVLPAVSISVPQGSYIGTYNVPVSMDVYDPFDQVKSVDLFTYYDADWHYIGTDVHPSDGWNVDWDTTGVVDQVIFLFSYAYLPGGAHGEVMSDYIILDRTSPVYSYHYFSPDTPAWPEVVEVYFEANDNLSGVEEFEMYVNTATDGTSNGQWVYINEVFSSNGTIYWDTTGMAEGIHQVAFAIKDYASNWNRWDSNDELTITYGQANSFLPIILRNP